MKHLILFRAERLRKTSITIFHNVVFFKPKKNLQIINLQKFEFRQNCMLSFLIGSQSKLEEKVQKFVRERNSKQSKTIYDILVKCVHLHTLIWANVLF